SCSSAATGTSSASCGCTGCHCRASICLVNDMVTMSPFRERPGSAGRPTPLNTVAIVDDADQPVASGQSGEIVVRGPMVFEGYWRREADNAETFRGGWHHTGDLGRFDADGYLWYQGRSPAKELIKPGGENVYPAEVERTLCEHPDFPRRPAAHRGGHDRPRR